MRVNRGGARGLAVGALLLLAFIFGAALPATADLSQSTLTFSPNGAFIVAASQSTPYVHAYPWSGSGFGTKVANPATLMTSSGYGLAFSPDGSAVVVGSLSSPFVHAYAWSSGFGAKKANPATLPTGYVWDAAFSPDGAFLAIGRKDSPSVSVYAWTGGTFGSLVANPTVLPDGDEGAGVAFNPDGSALVVTSRDSPYAHAYTWSGSFGSKFIAPAGLPAGISRAVAFSPLL